MRNAEPDRRWQHDFDFWNRPSSTTVPSRLGSPLAINEWAHTAVPPRSYAIWNGAANLVELDLEGPTGRIQR